MGLSLRGTTSGAVDINAPAVAGDNTITLPNGNGSANQFFKNSDTAGIITHSSMTESSSGVISIGDIDIDGTTRTITTGVGQTVGFSTDIKIQGSVRIEDPSVSTSRLAITYQGIDFQNTGAGSSTSATSHLLDDYEEGTFTFTLTDDGTGTELTDSNTIARYVRIGKVCHIMIHIPTHTQPGTGSVTAGGSAPFISAEPSVLIASGVFRGYNSSTRDLSPCVIIAGGARTEGGSDFYLHTADEFSNLSGYDAGGGWTRDGNFNAPGIFISGSYYVI